LRRKKEKQLIIGLENEDQNATWFLVSCEWLAQWKCFLENKISSSNGQVSQERLHHIVRLSENPRIGVLPPGPVDN